MVKAPQFVTDSKGRRIGVMLDLKSYDKLLAAAEDAADLKTYRRAKPRVDAEILKGDFVSLAELRRQRA